MSDLEKFTEEVRRIEKEKHFTKRLGFANAFRQSLQLANWQYILKQKALNGMSVSEAIEALCELDADNQVDKATTKAMNKIAKRLLEDAEDEI